MERLTSLDREEDARRAFSRALKTFLKFETNWRLAHRSSLQSKRMLHDNGTLRFKRESALSQLRLKFYANCARR